MFDDGPAAQNAAEFASSPSERHGSPQVPDHELLRRIGAGSYGEVWLARNLILLAQLHAEHRIDSHGGFTPLSATVLSNAWQALRTKFPDQFKPTRRD